MNFCTFKKSRTQGTKARHCDERCSKHHQASVRTDLLIVFTHKKWVSYGYAAVTAEGRHAAC